MNAQRLKDIAASVPEENRIRLDIAIFKFKNNCQLQDFTFPATLSSYERAYIHSQVAPLGYKSESNGTGANRRITISKPMGDSTKLLRTIELTPLSLMGISCLDPEGHYKIIGTEHPGQDPKKKQIPLQYMDRDKYPTERSGFTNRLFTEPFPKVPKSRRPNFLDASRNRLPIWKSRDLILDTIRKHQVIFIKGDTGCGKTTQVPQFILDEATQNNHAVRVVCTVPRRIAAISISDRVASERGEKVGSTVGYQIRLENRISACETLLTYCTSGILLRSLTSFDYSILKRTTHIIIDEVHERDRQTEFLLACLRDVSQHFPNIKLILMGADMDVPLMQSYFGGKNTCPIIEVRGKVCPVEIYFLEDILTFLKYDVNQASNNNRRQQQQRGFRPHHQENNPYENQIVSGLVNQLNVAGPSSRKSVTSIFSAPVLTNLVPFSKESEYTTPGSVANKDADKLIVKMWTRGKEEMFNKFIDLVTENRISVDYAHSKAKVTMLMACAVRGDVNKADILLSLGADPSLKTHLPKHGRNYAAKDWAQDHGQPNVVMKIEEHEYRRLLGPPIANRYLDHNMKERLQRYQSNFDDDRVDVLLIVKLLHWIHCNTPLNEAVLVFLPGYDDIVTLKSLIFTDDELGRLSGRFVVFLLHSNIQTGDQKQAFEMPKYGTRKIVLSTNIAETSLTIEDIVYVIDSGKVKEKSFDTFTGVSQLKSNWISKASANQRQGRAGRCQPGKCFRLYTNARYNSMNTFPVSEIMRSSLQELCLYARSFIRRELKIKDFFSRLPEPPAPVSVDNSLECLVSLGALDKHEQITKLGLYLLDLPIEPYLGKALIYGATLKCLDPILTIVTFISYREPFQLPANPDDRRAASQYKYEFSEDSMSDHMAALKAFQAWENSTLFREGVQRRFCDERYLSCATFEMVCGIRAQLLGQLRAAGFVQTNGPGDLKDLNSNSDNWALVKAILTATLYPNLCFIDKETNVFRNNFDCKIRPHQTSTVLMNPDRGIMGLCGDWVIYDEISQQDRMKALRNCTVVSDIAVALFAGNTSVLPTIIDGGLCVEADSQDMENVQMSERFELSNWIMFRGSKTIVDSILYLRKRVMDLLSKRLENPAALYSDDDELVVKILASVCFYEDQALGFMNVKGIGQWPKMVSGNIMSAPTQGFNRDQAINEEDLPLALRSTKSTLGI